MELFNSVSDLMLIPRAIEAPDRLSGSGRDKNAHLWAIEAHCNEGYHGCFLSDIPHPYQ